jgi:hypothetical protein
MDDACACQANFRRTANGANGRIDISADQPDGGDKGLRSPSRRGRGQPSMPGLVSSESLETSTETGSILLV